MKPTRIDEHDDADMEGDSRGPHITVAAVQLWSDLARTPQENRAHALEMLERAAQKRSDLIVLPEAVSMLCYPDGRPDFTYRDVAEPVPGPTTEAAADIARRHRVNVMLGLIADRGPEVPCQNLVVVIDREGQAAGYYEKTHEPEVVRRDQGAGTGTSFPIFDLDFARTGTFVCWDLLAPEVASILALKGARLLCFPHLIGLPSPRNFAVSLRARAVDNAVPIVAAGMRDAHNHNGCQDGIFPTCILDADGNVVAQSTRAGADVVRAGLSLASVRVDYLGLDQPDVDWFAHRPRELRVDLYARAYADLIENKDVPYGGFAPGETSHPTADRRVRTND